MLYCSFSQFSQTPPFRRYNQINAIGIACSMGVEGCKELIKSWYRQWMDNPHHNPWVQSSSRVLRFYFRTNLTIMSNNVSKVHSDCVCVWGVSLSVRYSFCNLPYVYLNVDQDPSQLEKHSLLHCRGLRRCGWVGLCLEDVQDRHSGIWSFQAQVGHGLHQSTLAFEQVCATSRFVGVSWILNETLVYACATNVQHCDSYIYVKVEDFYQRH